MTRIPRIRLSARLVFIPAIAATLATAGVAIAQDAAQQGAISLPENPQIFGENDPNHRKATVIINGEIITGTDIDQRTALIVAAFWLVITPARAGTA